MKNYLGLGELKRIGYFIKYFGLTDAYQIWWKFNFSKKKIICLKLNRFKQPIFLRNGTSDIDAFYQVFIKNEYQFDVDNPGVIIDGGANIGLFSIYIKEKHPLAKIIAVEPDPDNFEILKKNLQDMGQVSLENAGIWNKECQLKVYDKYNTGKWGMVVEEISEGGNMIAISISGIMEKYKLNQIDVLKLDIETSEKAVFSSSFED